MRVGTYEPSRTTSDDIDAATLASDLADQGVVLLRGLEVDDQRFAELTHLLGDRFTCDPAKLRGTRLQRRSDALGNLARTVATAADKLPSQLSVRRSNGTRSAPFQPYGINPHNENTYIPGAFPDVVWFYCERPASDGGATMLCDGVAALEALPERARDFMETLRLTYEMTFRAANWQNLYDERSIDRLRQTLEGVEGLTYDISAAGTLHYVYRPLQHAPASSGQQALRTNMLSRRPFGQVGDREPEMDGTGTPLPEWFVSDVLAAVEANTITVDLIAGDVIVIDNTRVMHGRTPFTDTDRRILTRCGWLRSAA